MKIEQTNAFKIDVEHFAKIAQEYQYTSADLKISLADSKKRKNKYHRYDLGDKLPLVDTDFLISILEAFPGCECFWDGNMIHALYFTHENGEAILLPCRKE